VLNSLLTPLSFRVRLLAWRGAFESLSGEASNSVLLAPGLYQTGAYALAKSGDTDGAAALLTTSWEDLLANEIVHVTDGVVYSNFDLDAWKNSSQAALVGELILPSDGTITSIGSGYYDDDWNYSGDIAFEQCKNLTFVYIPHGVIYIKDEAFNNCYNLERIVLPSSLVEIGKGVFGNCNSLTSIEIPDGVTTISQDVFYHSALQSVQIPMGTTSIDTCAFQDCSGLKNITIGNRVTNIAEYAFDGCRNLSDVYYTGTEEEWGNITIGNNNQYLLNATIHYNYVPDTMG